MPAIEATGSVSRRSGGGRPARRRVRRAARRPRRPAPPAGRPAARAPRGQRAERDAPAHTVEDEHPLVLVVGDQPWDRTPGRPGEGNAASSSRAKRSLSVARTGSSSSHLSSSGGPSVNVTSATRRRATNVSTPVTSPRRMPCAASGRRTRDVTGSGPPPAGRPGRARRGEGRGAWTFIIRVRTTSSASRPCLTPLAPRPGLAVGLAVVGDGDGGGEGGALRLLGRGQA